MRRSLIALVLVLVLGWGGYAGRHHLLAGYLRLCVYRVTSGLPSCDRVEVSLLAPLPFQAESAEGFPIKPYGQLAPIIRTESVSGTPAKALVTLWRDLSFGEEHQALCHDGVYGLRFYSGKTLRFETSVCFHCNNFHVPIPVPQGSIWWGFDSRDGKGRALWNALDKLVPHDLRAPSEKAVLSAKQAWHEKRAAEARARENHTSGQKP